MSDCGLDVVAFSGSGSGLGCILNFQILTSCPPPLPAPAFCVLKRQVLLHEMEQKAE